MKLLPDIVCARPRILFVGINPSLRAAEVGHHFAGRGNPFWRLLLASNLIPEAIDWPEDHRVAALGIALTNICPRPSRTAAELSSEELAAGARALRRKIAQLRPQVVAFAGLTVYREMYGREATPGAGEKPQTIAGARVFVVPNPSGLNASFPGFADKLVWFERLAAFAAESGATAPPTRPGTRDPNARVRRRVRSD